MMPSVCNINSKGGQKRVFNFLAVGVKNIH